MTPNNSSNQVERGLNPETPSLRLNYIFNFVGSAWTAALGILFVPIYLRYVGVEAYGIIGLFTSLQAIFFLLDLGLSPAFNREIARFTGEAGKLRTLTRTLATVNFAIAVLIGLVLCLLAPILSIYWVNVSSLSTTDVTHSFLIMGIGSALQFPITFYMNGLAGMQRQVISNVILVIFGTLRSVGALVVLAYYSPTLQAFLAWQALVSFGQMLVTAAVFYKGLPRSAKAALFDLDTLKNIWRFAAGNVGIGVSALVMSQTDKIVLSRMLDMETFGYYSLATMISVTALVMMTSSVSRVAFPEFSSLIARGDEPGLVRAYHKNSQFVAVLVIPAATVLAVFSKDILFVWTRNAEIAEQGHLLLTLSAIGIGINCLGWIPYFMQLAHGWTRLTFFTNVVAVAGIILLLLILVPRYGAVGGAASVVVVQTVYISVYVGRMHRRILTGQLPKWFFRDVFVPFAAVVVPVFLGAFLMRGSTGTLNVLLGLGITGAAAVLSAALSSGFVRGRIVGATRQWLRPESAGGAV